MNSKNYRDETMNLSPEVAKDIDATQELFREALVLEDKALLCINIVKEIFPKYADGAVENMAAEFMKIDTKALNKIASGLKVTLKVRAGPSNKINRYEIAKG